MLEILDKNIVWTLIGALGKQFRYVSLNLGYRGRQYSGTHGDEDIL